METKDIFILLGVFIVGSLVVTFLVNPNSFQNFKSNIKSVVSENSNSQIKDVTDTSQNTNINTISNANIPTNSKVKLIPSEMEEYAGWQDLYKSCAYIESLGESDGVSNLKQKGCREACGKRDMEYSSTSCEKDFYVCYCIG